VNLAPLRFLGFISYGLYLDHLLAFRVYDRICSSYWPRLIPSDGHFALILLRFGVAGGAAILLAYLSRRFFEEKFLRLKNSWEPKPSVETSETQPALAPVA
jgi:peptidoglycan/LPS O-acetylase OafA/YrhL